VFEERFVDLSQALQNGGVRRELFSLLDERANDINAHRDCAIATRNVCCL
jgi:hypothetical protein